MKKLLVSSILTIRCIQLNAQTEIGLGVEYGRNWLTNVNPNKLSLYGHSGQQSNQQGSTSLQPFIIINKKLWRNFDIEFGAGYSKVSHSFDFHYTHSLWMYRIDATVTFTDQWLTLPVNMGYNLTLNSNSLIRFGLGIRTQILLKGDNNFIETVFESVDIPTFHNWLAFSPELHAGYKKKVNDNISLQIGAYLNYNPFPMVVSEWGFYGNIYHSANLQMGIFLKSHYKISKR